MSPPDIQRDVPTQSVHCDLCGASRDQTLMWLTDLVMETTDAEFRLAKCPSCDLIYLNPRPAPGEMNRFYPDSYAPFSRHGLSGTARNWLYRRSVRDLRRYLDSPRRVLDIGCGTGELLHAVRQAGNPNILGIEPSEQAARIARERYGFTIITGSLDDAELPRASVDTVLLSHVLEHLPSPSDAMEEIARIVKPGGTVIIWLPNARSLAASWLGRYWMGWDVPRHLYSFTPGTVVRLLLRAGFRLDEIYHERHGLEWAWGLRLWARMRNSGGPLERSLGAVHPLLAAGLTPIGILAAMLGRSGRIRVIAHKPVR